MLITISNDIHSGSSRLRCPQTLDNVIPVNTVALNRNQRLCLQSEPKTANCRIEPAGHKGRRGRQAALGGADRGKGQVG